MAYIPHGNLHRVKCMLQCNVYQQSICIMFGYISHDRSVTISNAGLMRWPKSTSLFKSSSQRFGASSSSMVVMAIRVVCDAACKRLHPYTLLSAWNLVSNSMRPCFSRSSKRPLCFIKAICKEKELVFYSSKLQKEKHP